MLSAAFKQIAVSLDSAVRDVLETVVNRDEKRPPAGRAVGKRNSQAAADIHGHRSDERTRRTQRQRRNIRVLEDASETGKRLRVLGACEVVERQHRVCFAAAE